MARTRGIDPTGAQEDGAEIYACLGRCFSEQVYSLEEEDNASRISRTQNRCKTLTPVVLQPQHIALYPDLAQPALQLLVELEPDSNTGQY